MVQYALIIPTFGRPRQEDSKLKSNLDYIMRPSLFLKRKKERKKDKIHYTLTY